MVEDMFWKVVWWFWFGVIMFSWVDTFYKVWADAPQTTYDKVRLLRIRIMHLLLWPTAVGMLWYFRFGG